MPIMGPLVKEKGGQMTLSHPASIFLWKQNKLIEKGYSEYKSFEIVGKQIEEIITK